MERLASLVRGVLRPINRFRRREDGSFTILSLFVTVGMVLAVGVALDTIRAETARVRLQNVTDAAVLAAANLNQSLPAEEVVADHLSRAGIDPAKVAITVESGDHSRKVSAQARFSMPTIFMDMVGVEDLAVPAAGAAQESASELEIALVLDNSASMALDGGHRLTDLKDAANTFVGRVLNNEGAGGKVIISLVPYATQVSAGPDLLAQYPRTNAHEFSHCADFSTAAFATTALPVTESLDQTAHFSVSNTMPAGSAWTCPIEESRQITPWSDDLQLLTARIDSMSAAGEHSLDIGAKWGAAMLDPSSQPALEGMVGAGKVDAKFIGHPIAYSDLGATDASRLKYLVITSGSTDALQPTLQAAYRSGPSTLFLHDEDITFFDAARTARSRYYHFYKNTPELNGWYPEPAGGAEARQLDWTEVWQMMGVRYYAASIYGAATGLSSSKEFFRIVSNVTVTNKNAHTAQTCQAAKDAGIVVFTVGIDAPDSADALLGACASSDAYFYDVASEDIGQAFNSIAQTINLLRLTN